MTPRDRIVRLEREVRVLSRSAAVGRPGVSVTGAWLRWRRYCGKWAMRTSCTSRRVACEQDELFSYLELGDGPLHGHDLDGLARVLSRRGARVVVPTVRPMPEEAAVGLMVDLHANLASAAQALADARLRPGDLGFVCAGAG